MKLFLKQPVAIVCDLNLSSAQEMIWEQTYFNLVYALFRLREEEMITRVYCVSTQMNINETKSKKYLSSVLG